MTERSPDNSISIRDLQRNAAAVISQVEHGAAYVVTRHGRVVGRLMPPDPAEEALNRTIADGIIDPADLTHARTAAGLARIPREGPGKPSLSDTLAALREQER